VAIGEVQIGSVCGVPRALYPISLTVVPDPSGAEYEDTLVVTLDDDRMESTKNVLVRWKGQGGIRTVPERAFLAIPVGSKEPASQTLIVKCAQGSFEPKSPSKPPSGIEVVFRRTDNPDTWLAKVTADPKSLGPASERLEVPFLTGREDVPTARLLVTIFRK
jgi:hypothetical protein